MNSKIATIGLFGILVVAAFAGVVIIGDDADAETGYTVTYKVNGVTYSMQAESATVTLPTLEAIGASVDAGKSFLGWKVEGGDNTVYAVGSTYKIADGDTPGEGSVTFVPEIASDKYTVTFAYADGTVIKAYSKTDSTDTRLAYSAEATLSLPVKATAVAAGKVLEFRQVDGEIFIGWALAEDPETVVIDESESKIAVTGDADYVAVYVHDPVLTFIVDGTTIYTHTEYKAVLPIAPSKEGFSFVGWNDGELTVRDEELSAHVALLVDDVTLTAVWEPAVYTVAFVVDGETVLTQSVKHGETATEPKIVPAKDGFDFVAWTVGDVAYDFGSAVTGDLTVTASFEAVPAPAPTGLKDPMTQMLLIIIGTLVLALIAVMLWKRDVIRAGLVKRLDKGDKGNGGDGTA